LRSSSEAVAHRKRARSRGGGFALRQSRCPPPHPSRQRRDSLPIEGRDGVRCGARAGSQRSGELQRLAVPTREVMSKNRPPTKGDGAPKSANLWCPQSLRIASGASRRATCAHFGGYRASRYLSAYSAALERMLFAASPRTVRHRASLSVAGISLASSCPTRRTTFRDDAAGRSAGSQQGLVVVPGGAPVPPECLTCVARPAGAAPRPASRTPHDAPFEWTR
jgi:hypothetical protein